MKSLAGHLLVAVPDLPDSNFFRSVVLMVQHSEEGACGLILNRPTEVSVAEVWNEVSDEVSDVSDPVYLGGPVEGPLMAIHQCISLAEQDVVEGVYMSMGRENLSAVIAQDTRRFKIFTQYSGWSSGQLESEMGAGGWLSLPATEAHIFADEEELWKSVCDEVGRDIIFQNPSASSVDASLN